MRQIIGAAIAALLALGLSSTSRAAPPAPYVPTPELIEAAKKEGTVVWYTSTDVAVSEKLAALFQAKYSGIKVQVERAGAERVFQRINQEYGSGIHNADVIETSDAINFVVFKRRGWLLPAVPVDVAEHWPAEAKDADGQYAAYRAHLSIIAYNAKAVKPEDAPKSHKDLLDPKWRGRMVKAHRGYSGTIMTDTFALSQALDWTYLEKLGKQKVMQVQSSTEPPKKLAIGERPVMADGNEYNIFILKEGGSPVMPVYATDGSAVVIGNAAILKDAPHPAAAKLLYAFMFTKEAQQANSDVGRLRSFHPGVEEKAGRIPLSQIKLIFIDPAKLEPQVEDLKKKYEEYFGT